MVKIFTRSLVKCAGSLCLKKNGSLFIVALLSMVCHAQDSHYWAHQFGTRSILLSGASVAGVNDNSAVYNNPSELAFIDSSSISLSGNIYKRNSKNFIDGAGSGTNISYDDIQNLPLIISGLKKFKKIPNVVIGYGLLQKISSAFTSTVRRDEFLNIIADSLSPGHEEYIGQFTLNNSLQETLVLLGIGYKISDHLSVGLTNIIAQRSQVYNTIFLARLLPNPGPEPFVDLVSNNEQLYVSYTNHRYYAKFGATFKEAKWQFGLTVTTPSARIGGSGLISGDAEWNKLDFTGTGNRSIYIANDRQENLKANYRSPWSIAAGASYSLHHTSLFISTEYFGSLNEYTVIAPKADVYIRPTSPELEQLTKELLKVKDRHDAALNVALGIDQPVSPKLDLYLSGRTDFSYFSRTSVKNETGIYPVAIDWNIYYISAGGMYKRKRQELCLGVQYSFGTDKSNLQFVNFDNPTEQNFLKGDRQIITATYYSIGLIIGYTHYF